VSVGVEVSFSKVVRVAICGNCSPLVRRTERVQLRIKRKAGEPGCKAFTSGLPMCYLTVVFQEVDACLREGRG